MVSEDVEMAAYIRHLVRRAEKALAKEAENYDEVLEVNLRELRASVKAANYKDGAKLAYSIKGAAGSMGWPLISTAAGFLRHVLEKEDQVDQLKNVANVHLDTLDLIFKEQMKGEHQVGVGLIKELYALLEKYEINPST